MTLEGDLRSLRLPEVLHTISLQGKTGILTVQGEHDIIAVSFKDGEVVAADALNQTAEEGLGQVLAREGLVRPEDFAEVAAEHEAGGSRLLDLLVDRGQISRPALLDALRSQTYHLLLQLLRWQQGEFKFYAGDEVAYEDGFRPIPIAELLVRALRDLGEDAGLRGEVPDLAGAYRHVVGETPTKLYGEDGEGLLDDPEALWLSRDEQALLDRLDGRQPVRELLPEVGIGESVAVLTLYRLSQAGIVQPVRARPEEEAFAPSTPLSPVAVPAPPREPEPEAAPRVEAEPEPEAEPEVQAPVRRGAPSGVVPLFGVVAAGLAVAVLWTAWLHPRQLLFPTPWMDQVRVGQGRTQRIADYRRIDRAARTYFLLEGRYPDRLGELVERDLLSPTDLRDPDRRPLAYRGSDVSYEVEPVEHGEPMASLGAKEAITGDFLLDPEYLALPPEREQVPLVLLD